MTRVKNRIQKFKEGQAFTYDDLRLKEENPYALSKALSRLSNDGYINRLKKGVYYRPRKTIFGNLKPNENQILKLVITKSINSKGYITGISVYSKLGLTTQISNQVVIATTMSKKSETIGSLKIKYVKGIAPRKESDIKKLQLLDAIKDFKKIPDRNDALFIAIISKLLNDFTVNDLNRLFSLSTEYRPQTRALLGAILELNKKKKLSRKIKNNLNPLTKYDIGIAVKVLPNKDKWNIK